MTRKQYLGGVTQDRLIQDLVEFQTQTGIVSRTLVGHIAGILAEDGLNIATLKLTRKERGGDAFMVIELDHQPIESVRDALRALPWVTWAFRLDKVSA